MHHHPAIVVWATNNEVEVAAAQHWYGPRINKVEYRRRFLDSIAKIVNQNEMPSVPVMGYISRRVILSSPGNGDATIDPYGIDVNPQVCLLTYFLIVFWTLDLLFPSIPKVIIICYFQ